MKDNTLKPEPFHRKVLCWHVKPYKSFSFLRVTFVRVPPTTFLYRGLLPFILALWAFISFHFGLVGLLGLHFLSFWPCGPSFPFIFGVVGLDFLAFWPFPGQLLGGPPTSCQKLSVFPISHAKNIAAPRPAPFSNFWPSGPSFPFILALWAFISFHFGLLRLHFLSFWPFPGQLLGSPPPHKLPKMSRFPSLPYNEFSSAETGSIFQFLAFWAFISFHFGLVGLHFLSFWPYGPSFPFILALWAFISFHFGFVGLHFLAFWPCGPSCPCILALSGSASGPPPPDKLPKMARLPNLPYKEFSSAETGSIFQFLAFWAFISFHFGLVGLHFLSFWASFPFILALWAFISLHFGFSGSASGPPPHKLPKMVRFPNLPYKEFSSAETGSIFQFLAFWAFMSFHFGLVGLHFLSFWPCGLLFPCIFGFLGPCFLAFWLWKFISLRAEAIPGAG